jgi:hypothetical protein
MSENECVRFDIIRKVTGCLLLRPRAAHASLLKHNSRRLLSWLLDGQLEEWLTNKNPELMEGTDEDRSKVVAAIKECMHLYKEGEKVARHSEGYVSLAEAVKQTLFDEMDNKNSSGFDFGEYVLDSIMEKTKKMPSYMRDLDFWTNVDERSVRKLGPVLVHSGKFVNLHPHLRIAREFTVDMEVEAGRGMGVDDKGEAQTVGDQDDQEDNELTDGVLHLYDIFRVVLASVRRQGCHPDGS